jgi:hypothetical protein
MCPWILGKDTLLVERTWTDNGTIYGGHITPSPPVYIDEGDLYGCVQQHQVDADGQALPPTSAHGTLISIVEDPLGEAMGCGKRDDSAEGAFLARGYSPGQLFPLSSLSISHFQQRRCGLGSSLIIGRELDGKWDDLPKPRLPDPSPP